MNKLTNKIRIFYKLLFGRLIPPALFLTPLTVKDIKTEVLGNEYGGYIVPKKTITQEWICYNAGVGEDISFDEALLKKYGCTVFAFDPTPKSIAFVEELKNKPKNFKFYPLGIWSKNTQLKFFSPLNPNHVSHSIHNIQGTDKYFLATCKRLQTLMRKFYHQHIDLLKLDIEGAEVEVLADMLRSRIYPQVVCIEFDQPQKIRAFIKTLLNMYQHGYRIFAMNGWVYSWIRPGTR